MYNLLYLNKALSELFSGNRSFRQRVSSQTFRSQFANVQESVRKRYKHLYFNLSFNYTVQNTILCVNNWVWNLTLQTSTCQLGFNYTFHDRKLTKVAKKASPMKL